MEKELITTTERQQKDLICKLNAAGICVRFDEKNKVIYLNNFIIHYLSKMEAIQSLYSIFLNFEYYFLSNNSSPLIFDIGGGIGISTFFFKSLYPDARIVVFEPHPLACQVIEKNIKINNLKKVTLFKTAAANKEDKIFLYGEIGCVDNHCNIYRSSIFKKWGIQHSSCSQTLVQSEKLSKHINENVDFLKLNVEGAEYEIFEDLNENDKLKFIRNMYIKVHQWNDNIHLKERLLKILHNNSFQFTLTDEQPIELTCPTINRPWIEHNNIRLFSIKAQKSQRTKFNLTLAERLMFANRSELLNQITIYENILENIPAGIYWKNLDSVYIGINKYTLHFYNKYFSKSHNSIVGKKDCELYPDHLANGFHFNDKKVIQFEKEIREEVKLGEGKDVMYQISSKKPLYDKNNNLMGLIGITLDITDRHQRLELEKINNEQKNKLAEQHRVQELIKRLAHDIRSPLTSLLLAVENISIHLPDTERLLIQKITREIGNLANGILESTLIKHEKTFGIIDNLFIIALLIEDWFNEVKYQYNSLSLIEFNLIIDPKVLRYFIEGNKLMLRRAFFNIINNSVEAIGKNKKGKVSVLINLINKQIELRIIDTGGGITAEKKNLIQNHKKIFSQKKNGNGIGLTQLYETIEHHNATFIVDNNVDFNGLDIRICFNVKEVPHWIVTYISIKLTNLLVIVSKNREIYNSWYYRLKNKKFDVDNKLKHFYDLQDAINYMNMFDRDDILFFTESCFPNGDGRNTFDLIGYGHLCCKHYIISSINSNSLRSTNISSLVITREIAEQIPFKIK